MEEASLSSMFNRPPGFPKAGVVDPGSSWPITATSADWFSGPDDLSWPPQISLDSEEVELGAGDEPTSVEEDLLVDVTVPPSFQTVACSVALEDISELLHQVPSMQPRRRRTSGSQEQPPELLRPKDAEVDVVLPTPLCQQPPPRPWLQAEVLLSFGESGGPCLVALAHQTARIMGIVPQRLLRPALQWRRSSRPQWLSTVCQRHRYGLILCGPRAHPS